MAYLNTAHCTNTQNHLVKTDRFLQILKGFPNQWAGTTTYSTYLLQVFNPLTDLMPVNILNEKHNKII